jgi:hypothetical protein
MFSWNQCSSGTFYSIFNNKKSVFQHGGGRTTVSLPCFILFPFFEGNLRSIIESIFCNTSSINICFFIDYLVGDRYGETEQKS